jgi:hypothetical protein
MFQLLWEVNVPWSPYLGTLKADSHIACCVRAAPMLWPCRSPAMLCVNLHMPCRALTVSLSFVKVRVVAGNIWTASPAVLQVVFFRIVLLPLFTVVGMDRCEEDWYASDNNLKYSAWQPEEAEHGQVAHRPSLDSRAVPWPWEERHGQGMT